jgi:chromosome transmission fidelity protein 1
LQIYFSSRTHSQLSQVVNEIKNTTFGADIRVVSLASRQVLCINPEVNGINSSALLNEKCLELQKSKSKVTAECDNSKTTKKQKTSAKCPFMNQANLEKLKNHTLSEVLDIEDLVDVAKRQQKGCAYYSSRLAVADAQVVMVPYQILLHKKTREQFGIDLRNSIIIIDEAHNLLDTICQYVHITKHYKISLH